MTDERKPFEVIQGGKSKRLKRSERETPVISSDELEPDNIEEDIEETPEISADDLTPKQNAFVAAMLKGAGSLSEAYRQAYDAENMSEASIHQEASRVAANLKVAARLSAGFKAKEANATHSGASLRLKIEKELLGVISDNKQDAVRLRAIELLGKSEKVGYFLDRSTDLTDKDLTEEEVMAELQEAIKKAFNE